MKKIIAVLFLAYSFLSDVSAANTCKFITGVGAVTEVASEVGNFLVNSVCRSNCVNDTCVSKFIRKNNFIGNALISKALSYVPEGVRNLALKGGGELAFSLSKKFTAIEFFYLFFRNEAVLSKLERVFAYPSAVFSVVEIVDF